MLREAAAAEGAEERENFIDDDLPALRSVGNLHEITPAQVLVLLIEDVRGGGVDAEGALEIIAGLALIELTHEQQIGELFNHGDGVGDATGPESVSDFVYLGLESACNHELQSNWGRNLQDVGPGKE
ncbi:hypothetical protein KaCgl_17580 [Corynebacterium glutamicum]|nr:hypothetical protein KaCgl_17580 [Corynebacterium glutamicum]